MDRPSFPSLESLLVFSFQSLQTSLLPLNKIMSFLLTCSHSVAVEAVGVIPASQVSPRLVLNTLSNSQSFVRSGPAQLLTFALRPNNPLFKCDLEIVALIEQILDESGPLTLDEIFSSPVFVGSTRDLIGRIVEVHSTEFSVLSDGKIWFVGTPLPPRCHFTTIVESLEFAIGLFNHGATTEELKRILSLSTCDEGILTRLALAMVLSANPDRFVQLQRGRFGLMDGLVDSKPVERFGSPIQAAMSNEDESFNPELFFGGKFTFAAE
jgi:hypothetical protein